MKRAETIAKFAILCYFLVAIFSRKEGITMEMQKILIADGAEEFPMALAEMLRGEHHIRITAEGNQTLEVLRTYQPDVLVLDLMLPGLDGISLLQAVETAVELVRNGDYGIPVPDYVEENVSTKVVKLIQSYTGVVNKMVWRKF